VAREHIDRIDKVHRGKTRHQSLNEGFLEADPFFRCVTGSNPEDRHPEGVTVAEVKKPKNGDHIEDVARGNRD